MLKKFYILLLFLVAAFSFSAANITIKGTAASYKGKTISLETYANYFTYNTKKLSETNIDKNTGEFTIEVNLDETIKAFLKIANVEGIIYLSPKTELYTVHFPEENNYPELTLKPIFEELIFENLPEYDINILILDFNYRIDDFLYNEEYENEFSFITDTTFKPRLDSLKLELNKVYESIDDAYFYNFKRYSIASLELLSSPNIIKEKFMVYEQHLALEPVLYNHDMYMELFHQFYESELNADRKNKRYELHNAINLGQYTKAMNAIEKVYTKREDIKELVLLKTLSDAYYNEEFDKKNILKIIDSIAISSTFDENKKVAKNYFKTLTQLEINFPAPNFKFQTQQGNVISLNDLKGKHIYLSFMSAQSNICISQMNALKVLYEKYGSVVEFVTIFIDKDQSRLNHLIKDDYKWHIAHFNNSQELLNIYKIKTVPTYYLINEDGNLIQLPAIKPVPEGSTPSIDETFYKIKKGKAGDKEFNVGRK